MRNKNRINNKKRFLSLLLAVIMIVGVTGCGKSDVSSNESSGKNAGGADGTAAVETLQQETSKQTDEMPAGETAVSEEKTTQSDQNAAIEDTELGLKNTKMDDTQGNLTDEQKEILRYFSGDYMFVNSIEALQRYNKIFDGALVSCFARVAKVVSYDDKSYELLVYLLETESDAFASDEEFAKMDDRYMLIKGKSSDSRFIQGDLLTLNARYEGIVTETVDGVNVTAPMLNIHEGYVLDEDGDTYNYRTAFYPSRFDMLEVKNIAKTIFGDDITISEADVEESGDPAYVCTLDNQSNAKFSKYYFYERYGRLEDAVHPEYKIEFSADFQHFFLFMYDNSVETLTLEYYDNSLNKIWKREFESTTSASYDVTKNNIYLCANNEMYVINISTGEDTFPSTYVGNKLDIRKFRNGVLAISEGKSDAFLFTDLQGNIKWKLDSDEAINYIDAVQEVDEKLVIKVCNNENADTSSYYETGDSGVNEYYYVIDMETGELLYSGSVDFIPFRG